ncbi:hypothetical protein NDU88_000582 [Pleurodeles waltl]|uniref:Uncharacterized protein n=1 Tax=Pleurodeles waltl TaxID=8319 RepID=A0AAV7U4E0_PLEWA|nr:hypothetical protein NDU88_000582 [Pleurodeles waltl]
MGPRRGPDRGGGEAVEVPPPTRGVRSGGGPTRWSPLPPWSTSCRRRAPAAAASTPREWRSALELRSGPGGREDLAGRVIAEAEVRKRLGKAAEGCPPPPPGKGEGSC